MPDLKVSSHSSFAPSSSSAELYHRPSSVPNISGQQKSRFALYK